MSKRTDDLFYDLFYGESKEMKRHDEMSRADEMKLMADMERRGEMSIADKARVLECAALLSLHCEMQLLHAKEPYRGNLLCISVKESGLPLQTVYCSFESEDGTFRDIAVPDILRIEEVK